MKQSFYIVVLVLLFSCGGSQNFTEPENRAYENLKGLVNSKQFEIRSTRARPMATNAFMQVANTNILGPGNTASSIDISGSSNWLRVQGDTIHGVFPFFGEQNFGGGTLGSQHQGIEFDDVPKDYKVEMNDAKHSVDISFHIRDAYRGNENYQVFVTLFHNYSSTVRIQSTNRSSIEFTGRVKRLEEDAMVK